MGESPVTRSRCIGAKAASALQIVVGACLYVWEGGSFDDAGLDNRFGVI
ncbi:hypothetical protein ACFVGV_09300 [Pseudarthrobacter scleromae]